jgi:hypothetical protein
MAEAIDIPEAIDAGVPDAPAVAHHPEDDDPYLALCGARLMSIDAPPDAPRCGTCVDLHFARVAKVAALAKLLRGAER